MTHNQLVEKIAKRAGELSAMRIDYFRDMLMTSSEPPSRRDLRLAFPGATKADLLEALLVEEFSREFDFEIEEEE